MKILITALFAGTLLACGNAENSENGEADAAMEPKEGEWIDLLSSMDNWHIFNKPGPVGAAWSLKDGVLHLDASNKKDGKIVDGGNLLYNEDLENFHLKLEWKISPAGNSGILFYVKEDTIYKEPYFTGPEMQVLDNAAHPDSKIIKHRAGDLYDLISCSKETVKPVGEWNLAEIVANNGKLDFYLNGEHVVNTTMWDSTWNAMIAGSKFKDWPDFAKFKTGKIALQDHDNEVWFRNVMLKKL